MSVGIRRTFDLLLRTENQAAFELILDLVFIGPPDVAEQAFDYLIERRHRESMAKFVAGYHLLSVARQNRLPEAGAALSYGIRQAYLDKDPSTYNNALTLIRREPAYEHISLILGSIEKDSARKQDASELIDYLALELCHERELPPSERTVADVDAVRRHFLSSLEVAFKRFPHHKVVSVPQAYLILADDDSELIRRVLEEQNHSCHAPIIDAIYTKQNERYTRWIFAALQWRHPPQAILQIIAQRRDPWFINQLLGQIELLADPAINHSVRLIREIAWLDPEVLNLSKLTPDQQCAVVIFAVNSGIPLSQKLATLAIVFHEGSPAARQTAAAALLPLTGTGANNLLSACLNDSDPLVQLAAIKQIRLRNLPNALAILIGKLNHEDNRIRQAARGLLSEEYSFEKYSRGFDQMDERARTIVGSVIARVDERIGEKIRDYLRTEHRNHRIRAVRIVQSLNRTDEFWEDIAELLRDTDHVVRRTAIEALCSVDSVLMINFLATATLQSPGGLATGAMEALDTIRRSSHHAEIREAAQTAYDELPSADYRPSPTIDLAG